MKSATRRLLARTTLGGVCLLAIAQLLACSSDAAAPIPDPGGGDAEAGGQDGGVPWNDAGPGPSSDGGDAALASGDAGDPGDASPLSDAAPTTTRFGFLGFSTEVLPPDVFYTFTGQFYSQECSNVTAGACAISTCSGPSQGASAGTLTIAGGSLGDAGVALTPGAPPDDLYSYSGTAPLFGAGDTLSVSASGGADVPAFSATVGGVGPITVTAPALPGDGGLFEIPRSSDLKVTWTGGTPGSQVLVQLGSRDVTVLCFFDAASGAATLPQSTLATLPPGVSTLAVGQQNTTNLDAGGFPTAVFALDGVSVVAELQ
jgi:hypothetical protein